MKSPDQREYPRRMAYIIAEYTVREGTYRDVIKNIGAGGLFIRTSRKIALGQSIRLVFPLFQFDKTVRVTGLVIRRDPYGFAVAFDNLLEDLIFEDGAFPEIVHEGDRSSSE
jgi:Tfp pilus assembly protein PilZ